MGSQKLIYNPTTGKWLLLVGKDSWTFRATSDALRIAGFLQVNLTDKSSSDYSVVPKGYAHISAIHDFECEIELTPHADREDITSITVYPEQVNFGILDCYKGFHMDLWVETDSAIIVENIRALGLRFYLPESENQSGKTVEFFKDSKKIKSVKINRGQPSEVWLDFGEGDNIPQKISLNCSSPETNLDDERVLGMIFVDYNINLAGWKSSKELL